MLVADIIAQVSDAGGGADTSLILGIVSGATAVVVAFISYLGVKHRAPEPLPPTPPTAGADDEPAWVRNQRRNLEHQMAINERHEGEIDRLQRLLYLNGIDPIDGRKLGDRDATA